MKINICLPKGRYARSFCADFYSPLRICNSWERAVCDSQALYEKELLSLVGLNLLCSAIRNFKFFRCLDAYERYRVSTVLKLFCHYVKGFVYEENKE